MGRDAERHLAARDVRQLARAGHEGIDLLCDGAPQRARHALHGRTRARPTVDAMRAAWRSPPRRTRAADMRGNGTRGDLGTVHRIGRGSSLSPRRCGSPREGGFVDVDGATRAPRAARHRHARYAGLGVRRAWTATRTNPQARRAFRQDRQDDRHDNR